jgi:hypothetical protein
LRFEVFNLELGEGLAASHAIERDEDAYDAYCDHLLVEREDTREIVGTYRLQTGQLAAANLGYYSEQEFDFDLTSRSVVSWSNSGAPVCIAITAIWVFSDCCGAASLSTLANGRHGILSGAVR